MRIIVATHIPSRTGGIGTYTEHAIAGLVNEGHQVALLFEKLPLPGETILTLPGTHWHLSLLGMQKTLSAIRDWKPDVVFVQGLEDPTLERSLGKIVPLVFFAHSFWGTCISGEKTFKSGRERPCHRRFGWSCLIQYYPRRCGGWNPIRMWKNFRHQARRLSGLRRYHAIITSSEFMKQEYVKHGLPSENVHVAPIFLPSAPMRMPEVKPRDASRLMFVGRFTRLKGGHLFLDALQSVCANLNKTIVTFVGDGPDRAFWEQKAAILKQQCASLEILFVGWKSPAQVHGLFADCDLLILPSIWPEPYGIVGLEAGRYGVPVAAFDVGGISEWLKSGTNGYLAPGDLPTAAELSNVILKCLSEPEHRQLQVGALELSKKQHTAIHVQKIVQVFESVCGHV